MEYPSSLWTASRTVVAGGAVLSSSYSTGEEYKARAAALKGSKEMLRNPEKSTEPRNFYMALEAWAGNASSDLWLLCCTHLHIFASP